MERVILKTDLGYLKTLTKLQSGKFNTLSNKIISCEGENYFYIEYICSRIVAGWKLEIDEKFSTYKRDGSSTKVRKMYSLRNGNIYNEIPKMMYDFGIWIIKNELNSTDVLIEKDKDIQEQIEKEKLIEEKNIALEQLRISEEKELEENFKNELNDKICKYNNLGRLSITKKIHLDILGEYIERSAKMILVLIENIDSARYKTELKSILHLQNKGSRKIFNIITGLTLPKNYGDTVDFVEKLNSSKYLEFKEYKSKNKEVKKVEQVEFYIRKFTGEISLVVGEKIKDHLGLKLFLRKDDKTYSITEATTGLMVIGNKSNKLELLKMLKEKINTDNIDRLIKHIEYNYNKFGALPEL